MNPSSDWTTIDCHYLFPRFAASYLRVKRGRAIFIENNTTKAIPHLLKGLKEAGSSPEKVDYLFVTHAHLDHAGATGELAELFPGATVLAHPKAVRVLTDPSRLVEGAKQVYGAEKFQSLYGEIKPVPSHRIRELKNGESIEWEGEVIESFYTLGHASHHLCLFDTKSRAVFSGDAFGVSYPDLKGKTFFHIPSTSPVDFDAPEAIKAIEAIEKRDPALVYLTHFGAVTQIAERAEKLKALIRLHESVISNCETSFLEDKERLYNSILKELRKIYQNEWERCGMVSKIETCKLLQLDIELNAAGLVAALLKRKRSQ